MNISWIFLLLALIAEIIGTVGGFGSSVFFVPIGNFYFDFHTVLGLTALFHLSSNLSKIMLFRNGLNKHLIFSIGIPSVVFVIIGGFLSKQMNLQALELFLAIFLIALSLFFLIKLKMHFKPNHRNFKNLLDILPEQDEKMQVLFVGHGSPMNALEDNEFTRGWK